MSLYLSFRQLHFKICTCPVSSAIFIGTETDQTAPEPPMLFVNFIVGQIVGRFTHTHMLRDFFMTCYKLLVLIPHQNNWEVKHSYYIFNKKMNTISVGR